MNCGTVGEHPADSYPVQHLDIHHCRPEQTHFSPNRHEKGDTNRPLSQVCQSPPDMTIICKDLSFAMKKMATAIGPSLISVPFPKEFFGEDLRNFQTVLRLAQGYATPILCESLRIRPKPLMKGMADLGIDLSHGGFSHTLSFCRQILVFKYSYFK